MAQGRGGVARRRVVYIPGYDPFHARKYRELYRREGRAQAAHAGYRLTVARGAGPNDWRVAAAMDGAEVQASVEVLVWADLVKASMARGIAGTYLQLARTAWTYAASGALWRLMRLRKGPVIAAFYPVAMLTAQLLAALLVAAAGGWALALVLPAPWPWAAVLLVWPVLAGFRAIDHRLYAYYLMHDYSYAAAWGGANPPELEDRMRGFADRIAAALATDADEVLVVGHSSGAHIAVSVLADLIRAGRVPAGGPALGFLSLGQVVPMVSFLPRAQRLRADLHYLCQRDELTWVDVTAPADGCAFALCDPVAVSGVAPAQGKRWPLVVSAAYSRTLAPATWARLRWRFFRLHFQYLHAFDGPRGAESYDYFAITAGPRTLAERYAGRAPSRSRIERAVSPHTSMAA